MKNHFGKMLAPGLGLGIALLPIGLPAATVTWVGASGDWNATNNWSTGALPGAGDDVVIGSGPAITVTHSSGAHTVNSILSQQAFVLSGGVLTVSSTFQANNAFTLAGGTLQTATVVVTNGASLFVNGGGTLDGVTVNGVLDVGNTFGGTVALTDVLNNVGNSVVLNGADDSWELQGGTIMGGTVGPPAGPRCSSMGAARWTV
jgi:hypothetical protein